MGKPNRITFFANYVVLVKVRCADFFRNFSIFIFPEPEEKKKNRRDLTGFI